MTTRQVRKRRVRSLDPRLSAHLWVWRNWIKNGFRKASAIDYTNNGYCNVQKVSTINGDIFCLMDRSPIIVRRMREAIMELYKMSNDKDPIFVDHHVFERIKAVEHG